VTTPTPPVFSQILVRKKSKKKLLRPCIPRGFIMHILSVQSSTWMILYTEVNSHTHTRAFIKEWLHKHAGFKT